MILQKLFFLCYVIYAKAAESKNANPFCTVSCKVKNKVIPSTVCSKSPCLLNPDNCGKSAELLPLTRREKLMVEKWHNEIRNNIVPSLPLASNMEYLSYSEELEFSGQCWANQCDETIDPCPSTPSYPQNVGQSVMFEELSGRDKEDLINEVFSFLHYRMHSIEEEDVDSSREYEDVSLNQIMQIIWAKTKYFGCGRVIYHQKYVLVCNYYPGGNVEGEPIYKKGQPCSNCEGEPCNSTEYNNLCGSKSTLDFLEPFSIELNKQAVSQLSLCVFALVTFQVLFSIVQI